LENPLSSAAERAAVIKSSTFTAGVEDPKAEAATENSLYAAAV
jgi:hypothetical protein